LCRDQLRGPLRLLSNGYARAFAGVKLPEREADPSLPPSAKVKNAGSYTSTPHYDFMAWCLIKQWVHFHGMVLI